MTDWKRFLYPFSKKKISWRDRYADYNTRVVASIIDAACLFFIFGPMLFRSQDQFYTIEMVNQSLSQNPLDYVELREIILSVIASIVVQTLVIGAALVLCEYHFHTTPGRWLMGLKLVDAKTEALPTMFQLVRRFLGYFISLPPFMMGYLSINWDKKRQSWHDKAAGTVVLNTRPQGWYWWQVKRIYCRLRDLPAPDAPPMPPLPPSNDN